MRMYIPEIGDTISLTSDWTFALYHESRNDGLWGRFDCENDPGILDRRQHVQETVRKMRAIADRYTTPNSYWNEWRQHASDAALHEYDELEDSIRGYRSRYDEHVIVTFPVGTVLNIDRIYIRKGISDYSSVTFNVVDSSDRRLQTVKQGGIKGKRRFWAKLKDVNNIEFDIVSAATANDTVQV